MRSPGKGQAVEPAPAEDLYFLYFEKAAIPPTNVGGQQWPGGAPDPFAKLLVNDVAIIDTPVQRNSRYPTWPKQKHQNHRIVAGSKIYIEVWDDNPMTNQPICRARVKDIEHLRDGGNNEIYCDSGARVWLHVEPARALVGLGLYYETRGRNGVRVTRVVGDSPAARAGLDAGDRILAIAGKPVDTMDALQVRSEINLHAREGVELDVWFKSGKRHLITLKEGAIYPLPQDDIRLPE